MIKRIIDKLNLKTKNSLAVNPIIENDKESYILKKLSKQALKLYEKKSDINKFTRLAMSDAENNSQDSIIQDLVGRGLIPKSLTSFDDDKLSENDKFLDDLGL